MTEGLRIWCFSSLLDMYNFVGFRTLRDLSGEFSVPTGLGISGLRIHIVDGGNLSPAIFANCPTQEQSITGMFSITAV